MDISKSPDEALCEEMKRRGYEIVKHPADRCEHGVKEGDWCHPCNKAMKDAIRDLQISADIEDGALS